MATSCEDVLLLVSHVRHQKKDGTLYVMGERLAWIVDGKDVFSVSHRYTDVKTQKISPDGKSKVQLQVVLHDGNTNTFHFTHPEGSAVQLKARNEVKELLQQLLPKFKKKVNKELEEKNRMLVENPDLLQLYRDLVTSQIITPEEFWADHALQRHTATSKVIQVQEIGVSGAFLADVKPQTDGCNGLKYNLNADLISSIFKTYPAVKKKHIEHVPHKMTESEFWTRFFQSHYFHRDRISSGNKDVFAECAKSDEQDIRAEQTRTTGDALLDVTAFGDSTLAEGYGLGNRDGPSSCNAANRSLIRRFNHHSMMVLKAGESAIVKAIVPITGSAMSNKESGPSCPVVNGHLANGTAETQRPAAAGLNSSGEYQEEPASKKARLLEKTHLEDLEADDTSNRGTQLCLQRKERYLHGPTPSVCSNYISNDELLQSMDKLQYEVSNWKMELSQVLPSNVAVSVLQELSPSGSLMKVGSMEDFDQLIPEDVNKELRHLYSALCELMRHFWSCFPVTTKGHQEKVTRMRATLERFHYAKLKPFQDRLLMDHLHTKLTDHMMDMLSAAFTKFHTWQSKRANLKL